MRGPRNFLHRAGGVFIVVKNQTSLFIEALCDQEEKAKITGINQPDCGRIGPDREQRFPLPLEFCRRSNWAPTGFPS
jgi:hypothetical protein